MARLLWHNEGVASYRDLRHPELIRFPGLWLTRILIGTALFVLLLTAILSAWFDPPGAPAPLGERAALAAVALWLLACWPREIVCGPSAIEQRRLFGLGRTSIHWGEVQSVSPQPEFFGIGRWLGLDSEVIVVSSPVSRIRHTPRHPDRARFLQECQRRMQEWKSRPAAGQLPAGSAAKQEGPR